MIEDKEIILMNDPGKMVDLLVGFPEQLSNGRKLAFDADLSMIKPAKIGNIVICGMGGSAIGGDLFRAYAIDTIRLPISVVRDYLLPAFVGKDSLVIASSYSGNTEETLDSFGEALKRGAQTIIITTGGKLAEIAKKRNIPLITLPGGLPPRAALGYSFTPILTIAERLGFIDNCTNEIDETIAILKDGVNKFGTDIPISDNPAKSLAEKIHGKLPIIYSDDWHFNAVAVRIRGQINENAKQLAYSAVLPENNHNELVGWKVLGGLGASLIAVFLADIGVNKRVKFRMKYLEDVQKKLGVETIKIESSGDGLLARMFSLIQLGDWVSYYLAILNKEDPIPVRIIDDLKNSLANYA